VGIVDPNALPNSERSSPAAPSTVMAATLVVRFFLEARLTRMIASSLLVNALGIASLHSAKGARKIYLTSSAKQAYGRDPHFPASETHVGLYLAGYPGSWGYHPRDARRRSAVSVGFTRNLLLIDDDRRVRDYLRGGHQP